MPARPALTPRTMRGEEGLGEEPLVRLGHDQRDGLCLPGDERAGGPVGHVAELVDGCEDLGRASRH